MVCDSLPDFFVIPISRLTSSNISNWLSMSTRSKYKALLIVLKAQLGVVTKFLRDTIQPPTSASSLRRLRFLGRRNFLVPRTRTTTVKCRSFSVIDPSRWKSLSTSALFSYPPIFPRNSLFLKLVSFLEANQTKSASVGPRLFRGAI